MGFGVWKSGMLDMKPPVAIHNPVTKGEQDYFDDTNKSNPSVPGINDSQTGQSPSPNEIREDFSDKHLFAVNQITGTMNAALKYRDPKLHYNEVWQAAKMTEYLGVDLQKAVNAFPSGMEMKYTGNGAFTVIFENNGTLVEDRQAYEFAGNHGANVTILASKLRTPYDCLYQSDSNNVTSISLWETGETISVLVYADNMSETTMDYQLYVADFEYNGVYYRIIAENIAAYQLDALIREIAKQA